MRRAFIIGVTALLLAGLAAIGIAGTKSPHGEIKWDCQKCHTPDSWTQMRKPLTFAHDETDFPLIGAHRATRCAGCHRDLVFSHVASACGDCHSDPHKGQMGIACQKCHTSENWQNREDVFNLHMQKGFALTSVHAIADCGSCHQGQHPEEYATTPVTCQGCHMSDFTGTENPSHVKAGFRFDCESCHSPRAVSWRAVAYEHPLPFRLEGAHRVLDCNSCHTSGFAGTSSTCYDCHQGDYKAAVDPNHVQSNFDHDCATCHTVASWSPTHFDHSKTRFTLTGAHETITCNQCHKSGYTGTTTACLGCHQEDFTKTTKPNHVAGGYPTDCQNCHTSVAWSPASFDHNRTRFGLTGAHASVTCDKCHGAGYAGTSTQCYACHQTSFTAASDPNHVQNKFDHACEQCHTTTAWTPAVFDHSQTRFPLAGAHQAVACAQCHASGFAGTSTDCYSCHQRSFAGVKDPNHVTDAFDHDCLKCHTTVAWAAATFDHKLTRFLLTGAHQAVTCNTCHNLGFDGTPSTCYSCHQPEFVAAIQPNHIAGGFPTECQVCHGTTTWSPANFDHGKTLFPLTGAHQSVVCSKCHAAGYAGTSTACYSCHQTDFAGVKNPDHVMGNFDHDCLKCHSTVAYKPSSFDHGTTRFALTGAHEVVACNKCHATAFAGTAATCYACHQTDFAGVKDPNHAASNFDHDCLKCHTTHGWSPADFDHNLARFALTGAHLSVACTQCHVTGFTGTATDCYSCHQTNFVGVKDPNHVTNNFDHNCLKCHSTAAWLPVTFDHNLTAFPLTGAHVAVTCNTCHKTGFAGTASTCNACHQADFVNATTPNHVSSSFPTECQVCHNTAAWKPSSFNHNATGFALTGVHQSVTCDKCHAAGYKGTSTDCYSCHQTNFVGVKDPNHVTNNFDHNCLKCHSTAAWLPVTFDHNTTGFPLTGAHRTVTCNSCHKTGFAGTASTCYACHQTAYINTTKPNHSISGFATECQVCHNTTAWTPASFDHSATGFTLTGAHQSTACDKCHASGYKGTSTDCYSCHLTNFVGVKDPNHVTNNFDHDCLKCHSTAAWLPVGFDHNLTSFPLTGAHVAVTCNTCHKTGFAGTASNCYACHQPAFVNTTKPNHSSSGFPTECQVCHNTTAWTPASFDHSTTGFALTGAHQSVTCDKCHAAGYKGTSTDCYSCHLTNFAGVKDPNHLTNNFDHNCLKCHSTAAWLPVSFDHNLTSFSLTGAHLAVTCNNCHKTGFAGTASTCYACHQTAFVNTTTPNHGSSGFPMECQVCHNTAAWTPTSFNHATTGFPLTGAHLALTCVQCHAAGYTSTPAACYSCHQSDYAGIKDPDHTLGNFDHDCTKCHTTMGWSPSTFNHNTTGFVLAGAHQSLTCGKCHATGFAGTPTTCYACHTGDFTGVADPNHVTNSFDHDCSKCHSMTGWAPATFNHNLTPFPLTGAHQAVTCIQCHSKGYAGTPTACYSCHTGDFTRVTAPNHVTNSFDHDCTKCHSTTVWLPSTFNHSATPFPLTGAHLAVSCIQCHAAGYSGTPTACYSCHTGDFTGVANPNHVTNNFDHDCTKCHSTTVWSPSTFNHSSTPFPLTGAHLAASCIQCHAAGYSGGTPTACYSCHTSDFTGVADPNHVTNNFDHVCTKCHSTTAWNPATFNHSSTSFPLTGAHLAVSCIQCHTAGYAGTPTACFSCHAGNFTGVSDPNHVSGNFDHVCTKCHTTTAWTPATFDHNLSSFPLTGAHTAVTCGTCHKTGYTGTPSACDACHHPDYTGTTSPSHAAAGFPTDCLSCHNTTAWSPSTWNHDSQYFPIYSGSHKSRWTTCADCHINPASFATFECILCHTHSKSVTDSHHTSVQGYQYLSTSCYSCHPRGSAG